MLIVQNSILLVLHICTVLMGAVYANKMKPLITKFVELVPTPYAARGDHRHDKRQIGGCLLACGVLLSFTSCQRTATACQCSILSAASPVKIDICAGCMAIFLPAAGADLIVAADYCKGGNDAIGALSHCSAQCAPLLRGFGSCQNVSPCLCPTVSTAGIPCSECLAAINTGDAGVVGSVISQCGGGGNLLSTTQASAVGVTAAPTGSGAGVSGEGTSVSRSGVEGVSVGFGGQYCSYLVLLAAVAFMGMVV
jgi:hypothetical protein